eukprot:Ihof_evm2s744 gene=Ihof_evmTU2s744
MDTKTPFENPRDLESGPKTNVTIENIEPEVQGDTALKQERIYALPIPSLQLQVQNSSDVSIKSHSGLTEEGLPAWEDGVINDSFNGGLSKEGLFDKAASRSKKEFALDGSFTSPPEFFTTFVPSSSLDDVSEEKEKIKQADSFQSSRVINDLGASSPGSNYDTYSEISKNAGDYENARSLKIGKLQVIGITLLEMIIIMSMEIYMAKLYGFDNTAQVILVVTALNYGIGLFLVVDALWSHNSVQLTAIVLIKAAALLLTVAQITRGMSEPLIADFLINTEELWLSIGMTVVTFLGLCIYIILVRRLYVRLKWKILVRIGGFNANIQRMVAAYLAFNCVMKFCQVYTMAFLINLIISMYHFNQNREGFTCILMLSIGLVLTIVVHVLGHLESRFFIIPVMLMLGFTCYLVWQGSQFINQTCSYCETIIKMPSGEGTLTFFIFLSMTLSVYLFIGFFLSIYMYVLFCYDGFNGNLYQR